MCRGAVKCLLPFAIEIFTLDYKDDPDYELLDELLIDAIDIECPADESEHNQVKVMEPHASKLANF